MKQKKQTFKVVLIKPSHYDDDGYVIQWVRSWMPTNTLSCVHGIMQEAADRKVLGTKVGILIEAYDELSMVVPVNKIIRSIKEASGALVMMIGIQTNQYPRAVDLARPFRNAGIRVLMGGFHVSGCVAMVPHWKPAFRDATGIGISLFAGELEGHADKILEDAWHGQLKPLYNRLSTLPDLETAPMPFLSPDILKRTMKSVAGLDLGRGCPFKCSFCTVINVQGQKSRSRNVDKVLDYIRHSASCGTFRYLVTDDNFSRNKNWEPLLDAFIKLHEEEGIRMDIFFQVDTNAVRIPHFVEKVKRAGCTRVFIGMESVRQANLEGVGKNQNRVEELREMAQTWRDTGIISLATMIIGFPGDTVTSIKEDIRFIQENIPIDILQFFMMVPLPGSQDHQQLVESGAFLGLDFNNYDSEHAVMEHPEIGRKEWRDIYKLAWDLYYTDEHIEKVFKGAAEARIPLGDILTSILGFYGAVKYDKTHPLQSGALRRKVRTSRRYGMPVEPWWSFLPKRIGESILVQAKFAATFWRLYKIMKKVKRELVTSANGQ